MFAWPGPVLLPIFPSNFHFDNFLDVPVSQIGSANFFLTSRHSWSSLILEKTKKKNLEICFKIGFSRKNFFNLYLELFIQMAILKPAFNHLVELPMNSARTSPVRFEQPEFQ